MGMFEILDSFYDYMEQLEADAISLEELESYADMVECNEVDRGQE